MRLQVIAVGKIKERGLRDVLDDYYGRIGRYVSRFDEVELRDGSAEEVAERFAKAIPERARVVALEVDGKALSSDGLARFVGRAEGDATPALAFLIGGSYGLPPETSAKAHMKLSLSAMTLPHRIARVVLAEQVYRAFTILRGEPYSH
jgi:23S rRNA (pseudouridine1915-N3)-methyltransferase